MDDTFRITYFFVLQEFTPEYTTTYLMRFLMDQNALRLGIPARSQVVSVGVYSTTNSTNKYCRLKLEESGKAIIKHGWNYAVKEFNLNEGDVCMFSFKDQRCLPPRRRDKFAWLKLLIQKLEE